MHNTANTISLRAPLILLLFSISFVSFRLAIPYQPQYGESLTILAACICALFVMLLDNLLDPRPRPVHLLFCIYMIFYYLLPGYFHTVYGRFPFFEAGFAPDKVLNAAIVVAIFIICATAGLSINFPSRGGAPRVTIPANLQNAALFCAAAAVVAGAMYGFGSLLTVRGEDVFADTLPSPTRLIIGAIARSGSFYAFLFAIFAFLSQKSAPVLVMAIVTGSVFLLFNSPLAIPRYVLASYLIAAFCVFLKVTRIQKLALALALVASQATLFSYISYISRGDPSTTFRFDPFEYYVTSGDFDGLQSTINVVAMHDEKGGKEGINLLSAVLFFLPRSFWPQKSMGTGPEAGIYAGYPFVNLSSPLPSEFYVDFGLPGVVVLSFLFGLFVRLCDDYLLHFKKTSDPVGQVLVGTVAGYIFIILRGSLVATLGPIALSLFIASVCHRFTTRPSSASSPARTLSRDDAGRITSRK
ncbi:hypothetical protein [Methylocapsa aurea]|uniref:hypothetical protein n=1 Tax=Methylocapsa aurea TaxID=663610 RepID=UPI0012EBFB60|nr:hypothetical protein [Methylocapsa aurea]